MEKLGDDKGVQQQAGKTRYKDVRVKKKKLHFTKKKTINEKNEKEAWLSLSFAQLNNNKQNEQKKSGRKTV